MSISIAGMVLTGLPIVPLVPIWIVSLIKNRQYGDSARRGAGWLKATFPFLIIGIVTELASRVINYITYGYDAPEIAYPLYIGIYFQGLASVLTFIVLIETGLGFLYVRSKSFVAAQPPPPGGRREKTTRPKSHKIIRAVAYTLAACLLVLSTVVFGLRVGAFAYFERTLDDDDDYYSEIYSEVSSILWKASQVEAAFEIVCWVLTLPLLGFAISVVYKCKASVVSKSTHIFMAAVVVWFVRFLWRMVYQAGYVLSNYSNFDIQAIIIADPIFSQWLFMVVLILLFAVFAATYTGVWSIARPWMSYQQPIYYEPVYHQPQYAPPAPADNVAYRSPELQADGRQLHEMYQTPSPIYTNTAASGVSTPLPVEVKG